MARTQNLTQEQQLVEAGEEEGTQGEERVRIYLFRHLLCATFCANLKHLRLENKVLISVVSCPKSHG